MIRYIIILLFFGLASSSAKSETKNEENGFMLYGQIEGIPDGTKVCLVQFAKNDTIASSISTNGKFFLRGKVMKGTEYFYLKIDSVVSKYRSEEFLLINTSLSLLGSIEEWPKVLLKGSQENDDYNELKTLWEKTQNTSDQLVQVKRFINSKLNSMYIADLIRRLDKELSFEEKELMYGKLTKKAKSSYFGELLAENIGYEKIRKTMKQGKIIPDFSFVDLEGNVSNIHKDIYSNKITLIDFWASWCKPCREAIPALKEVYNKYSNKGFNIVSIALSDKIDAWKNAVKSEKIPWRNGNDLENKSYKMFDIPAIPAFILVDKKGAMLSFQCEGSQVRSFGRSLSKEDLNTSIKIILDSIDKDDVEYQVVTQVNPIEIGSQVPDIELGEILNHPTLKVAKISDFKGKLLILDFWSTWCSSCIYLFKHMEDLQNKFGNKLMILPIGFDGFKENSIKDFLEETKGSYRELKLPTCVQKKSDTLLGKLFPFGSVPHQVWITPKGELLAVTDNFAITADNIQAILDGKQLRFRNKIIKQNYLENSEPLLLRKGDVKHEFGSLFSAVIEKYHTSSNYACQDEVRSEYRHYWINHTIFDIYKDVYKDELPDLETDPYNKKVVLENWGNRSTLDWKDVPPMDNWAYDNFRDKEVLCYEILEPISWTKQEIRKKIICDLDSFLNVRSYINEQNVQCIAITQMGNINNLEPPVSSPFRGVKSQDFIIYLSQYVFPKYPLIIEKLNDDALFIVPQKYELTKEEIEEILRMNSIRIVQRNKKMKVLVLHGRNT